jgi:N-acetylneuraminic acid mutarotase
MKKFTLVFMLFTFTAVFAQEWYERESLPASANIRHHPITFTIDDVGYLVAGAKPGAGVLDDFYAYDRGSDSWQTLPDFPGGARGFSYGVSTDDKGYLGFGIFEDEVTFESFVYSDLWEYDPATEAWTELATCPCIARYHPAMVEVNNKIYVGLGGSAFGDLKDWWEYDIATDTWTEKEEFPGSQRHHPYYFGIGDYVYVGFGHHNASIFNDFYRYDPATDTWTELSTFPGQGRVAGTQFSFDGKGYILSGQGETHTNLPTGEFWEYDPTDDSWVELEAHPNGGRWAPGSFVIDGTVYFTCGEANTGEKKDLIAFDIVPFASVAEENKSLEVYPNPSNGLVNIKGDIMDNTAIQIYDGVGNLVLNTTVVNNQIDLQSLANGIYIVKTTEDQLINQRITIMN